jgi:methanogenic corrinoid protein MtbC1
MSTNPGQAPAPTLGALAERSRRAHLASAQADIAIGRAVQAQADARVRYGKLTQTLEGEVIPQLVRSHPAHASSTLLTPQEIERFVDLLMRGADDEANAAVEALRQRGMPVQLIFLQLFSPAARKLGALWDTDHCDFATVTLCLGRLQRLLRDWTPVFNTEHHRSPNGRRILLAQHPEETHCFGLSMVAEFFRADGWEVLGGPASAVPDMVARVNREWFDALGISVGTEIRIDWLREQVVRARAASRNKSLVVLVGGPVFLVKPELATGIGADAACSDGSLAPAAAERLMKARATAA